MKRKLKSNLLSIRQLAPEVNRAVSVVSKWIRKPTWPFGTGPFKRSDVPAIIAWSRTLQPNRAAGAIDPGEIPAPSDTRKERILKMKILAERGRLLELDRQERESLVVNRAERERIETAQAAMVKAELMTIRALALKLEGLNIEQREAVLEDWAKLVCGKFESATI